MKRLAVLGVIISLILSLCATPAQSLWVVAPSDQGGEATGTAPFYKIRVKDGHWAEYEVTVVYEKAIAPVTLEPPRWVSLRTGSRIAVYVLGKRVVRFENYSRELATISVVVDGKHLVPAELFERLAMVGRVYLDGLTFFMPVDEQYWVDFEAQLKSWTESMAEYGFRVSCEVGKCFYRVRIDHLLIGWAEVHASYEERYGVLKEASVAFVLTADSVRELHGRVGPLIVDDEPFYLEAGKLYGLGISMADTNVFGALNSAEFGALAAKASDEAIEKENVGALVTVKPRAEGVGAECRAEPLSPVINVSVTATVDRVEVTVSSEVDRRAIVININRAVFPVRHEEEVLVLLDGEKILKAGDYTDALNPLDEDVPKYFVLLGPRFVQVVVSIPHFSVRKIEIVRVPLPEFPYFLLYIGAVAACVALVYLAVRRRISGREKG